MPYVGRGVVMLIKINGGTLINGDESLCETCVHSRITKGRRLEKELVLCEAGSMQSIRDHVQSDVMYAVHGRVVPRAAGACVDSQARVYSPSGRVRSRE